MGSFVGAPNGIFNAFLVAGRYNCCLIVGKSFLTRAACPASFFFCCFGEEVEDPNGISDFLTGSANVSMNIKMGSRP